MSRVCLELLVRLCNSLKTMCQHWINNTATRWRVSSVACLIIPWNFQVHNNPRVLLHQFWDNAVRVGLTITRHWSHNASHPIWVQYYILIPLWTFNPAVYVTQQLLAKGPPFNLQGEGWSIFEINNLAQTLHEINNLLQELFYNNYKHVIKFKIFCAPPSRVEINNLSATKTLWRLKGAPLTMRTRILPCKAKMQYLLTFQVSRCCLLALQSSI